MDSSALGGNVLEELCKQNLEGEENGKARQQVTGDG